MYNESIKYLSTFLKDVPKNIVLLHLFNFEPYPFVQTVSLVDFSVTKILLFSIMYCMFI